MLDWKFSSKKVQGSRTLFTHFGIYFPLVQLWQLGLSHSLTCHVCQWQWHAGIFWLIIQQNVFTPSIMLFSLCLPALDGDGLLHSKVGRPMVLSLRVNQKVSYLFLPTAHLCTNILACFLPADAEIRCLPSGRRLSTHIHTVRHSHSTPNVCWTLLRRWQFLFARVLLSSPLEQGWHWSNVPQSSTVINNSVTSNG